MDINLLVRRSTRKTKMVVLLSCAAVSVAAQTPPVAHAMTVGTSPSSMPAIGRLNGDIPDSAVYLRYQGSGFSIEYVEGWLQTKAARSVAFTDKDSTVVANIQRRLSGDLHGYVQQTDLAHLARTPGFHRGSLTRDAIGGYPAMHLTYRSLSTPDVVTGKTVALQVDRYYINGAHGLALLTLSSPLGVDNVDGFRRIAHSFRFR